MLSIENLSIAAGLKIPSVFADAENKVDLDAGIDYTTDLFSVGATQVIAEVGGAYVIGDHKIRGGIAIDFSDSIGFSFPVYYKYSF